MQDLKFSQNHDPIAPIIARAPLIGSAKAKAIARKFVFISPRVRALATVRQHLRQTRQDYQSARDQLGASNKPGTELNRGKCLGQLNSARASLKRTMTAANHLLGRDTKRRIRKT